MCTRLIKTAFRSITSTSNQGCSRARSVIRGEFMCFLNNDSERDVSNIDTPFPLPFAGVTSDCLFFQQSDEKLRIFKGSGLIARLISVVRCGKLSKLSQGSF